VASGNTLPPARLAKPQLCNAIAFARPERLIVRGLLNDWLQVMRSNGERRPLNLTHGQWMVRYRARVGVSSSQNSPRAVLARIIKANAEEQPPQAATGRRGIHLIYHPRFAGGSGFIRNRTIRRLSDADRAANSRAIGKPSLAAFHLDGLPFAGCLSAAGGRLSLQDGLVQGFLHTNWKLA
jgi:hypothetical protein